jgi:acyl-coenzyme A thioesterase PaaI-like protein
MLDDAMGVTASISQRFALMVPTLQMSVSYLEPTPVARVIACVQVLRMGQTTTHLEAHLRLPDGTLLATATASAVVRPFPHISME